MAKKKKRKITKTKKKAASKAKAAKTKAKKKKTAKAKTKKTAKKTTKKAAKKAKKATSSKKKAKKKSGSTKKVSKSLPSKAKPKAKKAPQKKKKIAFKTPQKPSAKPEKSASKQPIPINKAYQLFLEVWDPSSESFFIGIRKLFTEYDIPGASESKKQENSARIIENIEQAMRKEPLSSELIEQLEERFDSQRIRKISSIMAMKPRTSIRLNTLKADIQGFQQSRAAKELKIKRCTYSPFGFDVEAKMNPVEHMTFERGLFEIEDEASQLIALLVNARSGQRVLDICAREGDHTLSIAALMKNKGSLFIYDADPNRIKILKERAQRAGVDNIRVLSDNQVSDVKSLDVILVDAPSSGTGILARQPEIKWRFRKEDLPKIHKVQAALLRESARKLKLGGRLIYVTSSLNRSENEGQIENFMKNAHNSYRVVPAKEYLEECAVPYVKNFFGHELTDKELSSFAEVDPFFMTLPDVHGCNGMFAAIIERTRISN